MAVIATGSNATTAPRVDLTRYPLLDEKQVGNLRHMGNLARQPRNDWSHMMGAATLGEDFGAYRYQLAYMSYALALAHVHRLPAAGGLFRTTMENFIEKIRIPDVWWEWRDVSRGGGMFNYDAPRHEGWVNPVVKDNIMYSAYLQVMPLLYNVMFNDDKYAKPGALTLRHRPVFWGIDQKYEFEYDQNSLNDQIYWNMVETGNLGVACEPYCVFQFCNQPPILGFRLHDMLNGGSTAEEVTQGYLAAWEGFGGLLDANGHYNTMVLTYNNTIRANSHIWSDAATGALMNAWNPEFVQKHYPQQRDAWLIRGEEGTLSCPLQTVLRDDVWQGGIPGFGWLAAWASEMGDTETVEGLLAHADRYMSPTWTKGGYFYPRNDELYDEDGHLTAMHPLDGGVMLSYARLNVKDGLRKIYEKPWDDGHFERPALDDVAFAVDVARAIFEPEADTLIFDVRRAEGHKPGEILIGRTFGRGEWTLWRNQVAIVRGNDDAVLAQDDGDHGVRAIRDGGGLRITINHFDYATYLLSWTGVPA